MFCSPSSGLLTNKSLLPLNMPQIISDSPDELGGDVGIVVVEGEGAHVVLPRVDHKPL